MLGNVLYHAVSSYQLLEVMLHRMTCHPKDRAVLILPDFIQDKYPWFRKLEKGFFDRVHLFPYLEIPHDREERIVRRVIRCCEKRIPERIGGFSHIYAAGAHFYFTLYLIEKRIPFSFLEDAAGMLSRPEKLRRELEKKYPLHSAIAQKYGLFDGSHPLIKEIVCLKRAQSVREDRKHYVDFSVEDQLERIGSAKRRKILRFFRCRKIWTGAEGILLTQNFAGLHVMNEKQQEHLYRELAKGPLGGVRLLIKRHPDDRLDYTGIFPKGRVIKRPFPAELLPYVFFRKPKMVYTVDSTACENLRHHFQIEKLYPESEEGERP